MNNFNYILLLFPIIGVGLFFGGLVYRRRLKKKAVGCERTVGTVINNVHGPFPGRGGRSPVVEYYVRQERFTIIGDVFYAQDKVKGSKMAVLFRPANPSEAYLEAGYYVLPNSMLFVGGGFMLLSLWVVFLSA